MTKDVLIIDDQAGIRMLLSEMLTHAEYKVYTVSNGKEALDALEKQTFRLLILDYQLPILNGAEVLSELEKRGTTTPVILMSGMTEKLTEEQLASPLIKHVISKPFDIQHVLKLVKAILSR